MLQNALSHSLTGFTMVQEGILILKCPLQHCREVLHFVENILHFINASFYATEGVFHSCKTYYYLS